MTPLPIHSLRTRNGCRVQLRPVGPHDADALGRMIESLSPRRLQEMTCVDGRHRIGLIATVEHEGAELLVADVRCVADASPSAAEFAVVVAEGWRSQGIARRDLADNLPTLALMRRCGYALSAHRGDASLQVAELRLPSPRTADRH